jgi:23S rRNA pseudouridine1911/1915/1917 synthase
MGRQSGRARRSNLVTASGWRCRGLNRWTSKPEAIPFDILHEDAELLVLHKPAGLVVHPAPGNWSGTLVNALLHHFATSGVTPSHIGGKERPGLVHRLDKETSGVMVIAKTDQAHRALAAQFKLHTITRVYEALIWGVPKKGHGPH